MSRWTGDWLSGPRAALEPDGGGQEWRGQRLGLPRSGPGAVSSTGRRAWAFLLDCVLAGMLARAFVAADIADTSAMLTLNLVGVGIYFVIRVVPIGFFGFSPGMGALGIRIARLDGAALVGPVRALVHSLLSALIIPAVVWDADNRGLHDRLLKTVVITMR